MLVTKRADDTATSVCPYHESCLEGLASGPAIEKRWGLPAAELVESEKVWELEADYLAQALTNYTLCYSPQRIILGGGVMHQQQLFPLIRKKMVANLGGYLRTSEIADIDSYIVPSSLDGDQGILGALELARRAEVLEDVHDHRISCESVTRLENLEAR